MPLTYSWTEAIEARNTNAEYLCTGLSVDDVAIAAESSREENLSKM